jgi:hypothetical protein
MYEDVETRIVVRSFKIKTYKADQMLLRGNENEDGSIEQTEHMQVLVPYDKKLFRVMDDSGKLLDEITVDEGMVDLLKAIWRHGIPTNRSCQGENGETAWISFESYECMGHFLDLVLHISGEKWRMDCKKSTNYFGISFPQEDIKKITEELNRTVTTQLIRLAPRLNVRCDP